MPEITQERLKELYRAEAKLNALEAGGVDNWEWYDESLEYFLKYESIERLVEETVEEFLVELHEHIEEPAGRGCGYGIDIKVESTVSNLLHKFLSDFKEISEGND